MKHHYVPQFLLRRWCDGTGRVQSFSVRDGRVLCSSRGPAHTGYESALYALVSNALGIDEDHPEKRFFSPLDSNAAIALGKIERREALRTDDKFAWAFFLNSLRIRQPDVLAHIRTEGMQMLRRFLSEGDEALPAGAPATEERLNEHLPGGLAIHSLTSWLPKMVLHDAMTDRFLGLHWWVVEFVADAPKLLLSDLPMHWEGGIANEDFFIPMPIAPDRLFLGTGSKVTERYLDELPRTELIRRVNRTSLASSSKRIWGADSTEGRLFIEANIDVVGTNVEPFANIARRFLGRQRAI